MTWGRLLSENGSRIKLGQDFFPSFQLMQKTYNVLRFCFSWKKKQQHIFTKMEVLSGLNAHAEEDLGEAILIAVQIAWMNESPKITVPL